QSVHTSPSPSIFVAVVRPATPRPTVFYFISRQVAKPNLPTAPLATPLASGQTPPALARGVTNALIAKFPPNSAGAHDGPMAKPLSGVAQNSANVPPEPGVG
ncbi:MAG: hypothetical protein QOD56_1831, partial [Gammaproteobacteria bacterium]|nr:hypothetical protein [Gammaproteobacteria bacterium]